MFLQKVEYFILYVTAHTGALSFEALVNGEIDSSAEKIEVNRFMHHDLQPGTFYSYEVYSLGTGDKRSFEASPSLDIQTGTNSLER